MSLKNKIKCEIINVTVKDRFKTRATKSSLNKSVISHIGVQRFEVSVALKSPLANISNYLHYTRT